MLKVNRKCCFAQYNGPKTYKYNYYVSPKYGVNYSLLCFVFLRDQSLYHIKHLAEAYCLLVLEYMRVIEILNFEHYNQIFLNSIIMFSFLQLQFSFLNQCSNNAHREYPITLLRYKPH